MRERVLVHGVVREARTSPTTARATRGRASASADRRTLILAVVDGRSESADGRATVRELGQLLRDLGAWEG